MATATANSRTRNEIIPGVARKPMSYRDWYRERARDCDILLWEPASWYGHVIAQSTDGPFCHVTAAALWGNAKSRTRVMSVGYDEQRGGVAVPLSNEVAQYPGKISAFRLNVPFDREAVLGQLISDLGGKYAWGNIRLFAIGHFLGLRLILGDRYRQWVAKASQDRTASGICSQHVARSFFYGSQNGGHSTIRFVSKDLADVSPNDIGLSAVVQYLGTLVP